MCSFCRQRAVFPLLIALMSSSPVRAHPGHSNPEPKDSPAVNQTVRTGSADCLYETVANWCHVPEGRDGLGPTHGAIVLDRDGDIYCSMDSGEFGILVYRSDGLLIRQIGKDLAGIHGMCICEEDGRQVIYAAHLRDAQVLKLSLEGEILWAMNGPPLESGKYEDPKLYKPTAIAVAPNGNIYVADGYGTNWIHRFDATGKYLASFGGRGEQNGEFRTCHGLALDTRGERPLLLVCDRENRRLQHYDLDGNFVATVTENLRRPCSVAFFGDRVAVAELEGRVTILDGSNNPIAHLGDNPDRSQWANFRVPAEKWQQGIFTAPHAAAFDKEGNLYVMDWNSSGRISRLDLVD